MRSNQAHLTSACILALTAVVYSGCRSHADMRTQYVDMRKSMLSGDWQTASKQLEASKDKVYKEDDRVMYWLNMGTLLHYAGNGPASQEVLVKAETAMQDLWTTSISAEATKVVVSARVSTRFIMYQSRLLS